MSNPFEPGDQPLPSRRELRAAEQARGRRGKRGGAEPDAATTPAGTAGQPSEEAAAQPSEATQLFSSLGAGAVPPIEATQAFGAFSAAQQPTQLLGAAEGGQADSSPASGGGIGGFIWKHPKGLLAAALGLAFVLAGTGAVYAGMLVGPPQAAEPVPVPTETTEEPGRIVPEVLPAFAAVRTCSVAGPAADGRLSTLSGQVIDAATGEVLYDLGGEAGVQTGSIMQIITAAAVLKVLGPDARLTTKVVAGSSPGTIVLVGGGDPTLATTTATLYEGAPLISDLADQVESAHRALHGPGQDIDTIVLDASLWPVGDAWDSSWPANLRTQGAQAPVTALMVDGGRADPGRDISPRSADPVTDAGYALGAALGFTGGYSSGSAVSGTVLGQVQSQPMSVLVEQMLQTSDAALAENLARVLSVSLGMGGTAESVPRALTAAMQELGLRQEMTIRDASGRSDLNRVPPALVARLLELVHDNVDGLGILREAMPLANRSGDLYDLFEGSPAAGLVNAVPGGIYTARTMAGLVSAADGSTLAFSFSAVREGIEREAREALAELVTAIYGCGSTLSRY